MIVKTLDDLKADGAYKEKPGAWSSARYLTRKDGVGFTMTHTKVAAGADQTLEYKNHLEANLVMAGKGELTDVATGKTYALRPGTIYVLDEHERHRMTVEEEMSVVCIFVPALVGTETHDEDGSYPLLEG